MEKSLSKEVLSDDIVDEVSGGKMRYMYYEEVRENKVKGGFIKGYVVDGENLETGIRMSTRFVDEESWSRFKKSRPGDFIRGLARIEEIEE